MIGNQFIQIKSIINYKIIERYKIKVICEENAKSNSPHLQNKGLPATIRLHFKKKEKVT